VTCPASASTIPNRRRAKASFSLRQGFFVVALAVGLLVWGLLIFVIVRYRRRSDAVPSQRPRNITVEVDHTVAPIFTVAVLFGFSVATDQNVTDLDP
jgi:cytochrome c oxidase subunit II